MLRKVVSITAENCFLHFPVKTGVRPRSEVEIFVNGERTFQFAIELANEGADDFFFLELSAFVGKELEVVVPVPKGIDMRAIERVFAGVSPAKLDEAFYPMLYKEALRPQFHFSSARGWLNDPNGLYYHDGVYHLFYQHNPLGVLHGEVNVTWGHAVSKNLIAWQEIGDAILPWRRDWFIASGSAFVDIKNAAGYGAGTIIAAFTALGAKDEEGNIQPSGGQFLAYSHNEGKSFTRFSDSPQIPVPNGDSWRDPLIFEDGGRYYIAVYEHRDGINGVSFYVSDNFHNWEFKSFTANLFECPDIFKLDAADGLSKWVLFGADGLARLGSFSEGVFIDDGISFPLDYGTATYAGQTWSHAPNGRRLHISWIRGMGESNSWEFDMGYPGMPFSQCMSLPCDIELKYVSGNYHLCRYPVKELQALRKAGAKADLITLGSNSGTYELPLVAGTEVELCVDNTSQYCADGSIKLTCNGRPISIDLVKKEMTIEGYNPRKLLGIKPDYVTVRIFTDASTIEIFIEDEASATYSLDTTNASITLEGCGQARITAWELDGIWHS